MAKFGDMVNFAPAVASQQPFLENPASGRSLAEAGGAEYEGGKSPPGPPRRNEKKECHRYGAAGCDGPAPAGTRPGRNRRESAGAAEPALPPPHLRRA